jgi:hypothetical protein
MKLIACPDCGFRNWDTAITPHCPGCLLSTEDLEAAADFFDRLITQTTNQGDDQ